MAAPVLSVNQAGNPFVEVFFEAYLPGTVRARVERVSDGRRWDVRGGLDVSPGVPVLDSEVPFCVPATYRAECFGAAGQSLGFTDSATVTVWEDRTIVHQPLDPSIWVSVVDMATTAEELLRRSPGESVRVEGSPYLRRIGGVKEGLAPFRYQFDTFSYEAADMVQRLTGTPEAPMPAVVCVRMPPPVRLPRTLFLDASELVEIDQNVRYGGERVRFEIVGGEVEPPFPGLSMPSLTYDDFAAAYGSYELIAADFTSYTDMARAYHLAGTA